MKMLITMKRKQNQSPAKRFARCLMGRSLDIHREVIELMPLIYQKGGGDTIGCLAWFRVKQLTHGNGK